jgi:hypothetical protein
LLVRLHSLVDMPQAMSLSYKAPSTPTPEILIPFVVIVRRVVEARKLAQGGQDPLSSPLQSHSQSQSPPQGQTASFPPAFHNNAVSQTQPLTPLAEKSAGGLYDDQTALDRRKPNTGGAGAKIKNWFKKLGTCFR